MRSTLAARGALFGLLTLLSLQHGVVGDVITKPDGLKIEDTRHIECDRPTKDGDIIRVHYTGTLTNGVQFDESWKSGRPFAFTLGRHEVIAGWDEGLLDMCVGTRRKLTIPPELGYGERGIGLIPPNSILLFETQLMHIKGVSDPPIITSGDGPTSEETEDKPEDDSKSQEGDEAHDSTETGHVIDRPAFNGTASQTADQGSAAGPATEAEENNGECRLLGPFALLVQGALGVLALLSLVIKRYRERPRRPVKIWFFDASKQVVGTALLHVANLAMSMFSSGAAVDTLRHAAAVVEASKTADDQLPNPCSFYLLNLAIDTTIGIPILVVLLRLFHALALRTPLAKPPESLKSGHYGNPPRVAWWMKQSLLYFLGLFGMKLFVLFLFSALPWLPWVGDWALRWTEGNEALQIAFVMFIFPLAMNAMQYYIIDAFIKEDQTSEGYESVGQQDDGSDGDEDDGEVGHDQDASPAGGTGGLVADGDAKTTMARVEHEEITPSSPAGSGGSPAVVHRTGNSHGE